MNTLLNFARGFALTTLLLVATLTSVGHAQSAETLATPLAKIDLKFSFGPQPVPGFVQVKPDDNYTIDRGYGFDLGSSVTLVDREGGDPLKAGFTTGSNGKPFFFSAKLPPGVYRVTITLGDSQQESTTTVKAETRRLMLESVQTAPGEITTKTFLTHLRVPQIPGGQTVALKSREKDLGTVFLYWEDKKPETFLELDWDEKLTLEFSDAHPALCTIEITNEEKPLTVYLVGDSTMTDQMMEPWGAWGMQFPRWFKPPVVIANYAESGESAVSFIGERRWPKLMSEIHAGDYVLIQFGINDRSTPIDRFKQTIEQMVSDVRAHGAIPVLITSQNLRTGFWGPDGKGQQTLGAYPYTMWQVATEQKTAYIDLNVLSTSLYEAFGQNRLPELFTPTRPAVPAQPANGDQQAMPAKPATHDGTHHSDFGSYELAKCVVQACIDAKLRFALYVVDDWKTFDPNHPDSIDAFKLPLDPQFDPACAEGLPKGPVPVAGHPGETATPPAPAAPRGRGATRGPAASPAPAPSI
jgi:lysophospholipase L1-like esterase